MGLTTLLSERVSRDAKLMQQFKELEAASAAQPSGQFILKGGVRGLQLFHEDFPGRREMECGGSTVTTHFSSFC